MIAVLQNNYKDGGGGTPTRIQAISLTATAGAASAWRVVHGRFFTLPMPYLGDFTASSDTITNVGQGDGTIALTSGVTVATNTTNGSPVVAVSSASGIMVNALVTGTGIPAGAKVVSIAGTNVTLSANATATGSGVSITFSNVLLPSDTLFLGHQRRPLLTETGGLIMGHEPGRQDDQGERNRRVQRVARAAQPLHPRAARQRVTGRRGRRRRSGGPGSPARRKKMALIIAEPPALAVPLAEVKAFLRIGTSEEDALLAGLVRGAAETCEAFTGRALIARPVEETLPAARAWTRLGATPVRAIEAVAALAPDGMAEPLPAGDYAIDIDAAGDGWVRLLGGRRRRGASASPIGRAWRPARTGSRRRCATASSGWRRISIRIATGRRAWGRQRR